MAPIPAASVFNWAQLSATEQQAALVRPELADSASLNAQVRTIIDTVRQQGDEALVAYSQQFDGLNANPLRLSPETKLAQLNRLLPERKAAIELAYDNIRKFHAAQLPRDIEVETSPGVICQLKSRAIAAVGLYIPGGSAPLPSTVLMLGVPAQLAGCERIVLVTPPGKPDAGDIAPEILYAAELCGISEIYTIGGAQAVVAHEGVVADQPGFHRLTRRHCGQQALHEVVVRVGFVGEALSAARDGDQAGLGALDQVREVGERAIGARHQRHRGQRRGLCAIGGDLATGGFAQAQAVAVVAA